MSCNQLIATIYTHKQFTQIVNTLPERFRDDLRQELAVYMLGLGCEKLSEIWASKSVWRLLYAVAHNMASMKNKNNPVTKMFATEDYNAAIAWMKAVYGHKHKETVTTVAGEVPVAFVSTVWHYIKGLKDKSLKSNHQYLLFNKWVELGSCLKVANYYGIPHLHVSKVIKDVKKDLLCLLKSS